MESKNYAATAFQNQEFGSVRMIQDEKQFLFCAIDVAYALGYRNPANAINRHCKGCVKRVALTNGGNQTLKFIPEGDVYRLISHSKLESAQRFEKWIFEDVLTAIRKTGGYMTDSLLEQVRNNPEILIQFAEQLLSERNRGNDLEKKITQLQPKAQYYDHFVNPGSCTNIRTTAKELEIPERKFCNYLINGGFLYRGPSGNLLPYAAKKNKGLFIVRDFFCNGHLGSQTLITPKGKIFFNSLFYGGEEIE